MSIPLDKKSLAAHLKAQQRRERLRQLRAEGMTYEQIAKRFRITRGRAHQIVNGVK